MVRVVGRHRPRKDTYVIVFAANAEVTSVVVVTVIVVAASLAFYPRCFQLLCALRFGSGSGFRELNHFTNQASP